MDEEFNRLWSSLVVDLQTPMRRLKSFREAKPQPEKNASTNAATALMAEAPSSLNVSFTKEGRTLNSVMHCHLFGENTFCVYVLFIINVISIDVDINL